MGNFIKIDRKILEWEWYRNEHTKNVFLHCLLKANWKEGKFEGKTVPRGSFITSIKKIALELDLTEDEVKTALKHLLKTGELTKQTTNKYTVITVSNYELYQEVTKQNQNNSQTDTEPLPNNSTSIPNLFPTIEEYKEREEDKEVKKESKEDNNTPPISPSQGEAVDEPKPKPKAKKKGPTVYYPNDEQLDEAFKEFLVMRNKIKKPLATQKALTRMMNRIEKLSGGDNDLAIKILNQSTDHCWQDVYELKGDDGNGCTRRNNTADKGRDAYAEEFERMLNGG